MAGQHKGPQGLEQEVLALFPVAGLEYSYPEIAELLDCRSREDKIDLSLALQKLLKRKAIQESDSGKFGLFGAEKQAITGKVDFVNPRIAYIRLEGLENVGKDVVVSADDLRGAQDGDLVEIELFSARKGKRQEGQILKVLQRARNQYVGTLKVKGGTGWFTADYRKMHEEIMISEQDLAGARDGQKVQVEITHWGSSSRRAQAKVKEILGKPGEHNAEMHGILADYNIPLRFSEEVEQEVAQFSGVISDSDTSGRRDFRPVLTFTIDPFDAKDFDDAISVKKLDNGNWEIGVHIADVSHFVKPGSKLDEEAFQRATSVYLVDRVSPMLPERLSNDLCSLRPNEDKLTFSCVVELNEAGVVSGKPWIGRTVIHSDRRYTYEEVQTVLEGAEDPNADHLRLLNRFALVMRDSRMAAGAMSFESTEVKFLLDENGVPLKVITKIRKDAHKLIEEFMLLANRLVAEYAFNYREGKKENPMVYRIHESPNPERLQNFADFASRFGYKINVSQEKVAMSLNSMVVHLEGRPEQELMQNLAIRVMAKARYTTKAMGHFGLSFAHYSHFTSPIRRYPDVLTHRLLWNYLNNEARLEKEKLETLCNHCSEKEKMAADAERASVKYKQVEYMSFQDNSKVYEGVVSGVTEWGIFVEIIENRCEGMVRVSELTFDTFDHLETEYCLAGRRTGTRITFGDRVKVRVKGTNMEKRSIDFYLEEIAGKSLKNQDSAKSAKVWPASKKRRKG